MKPYILLIAPALVLGACQGPAETAGAEKDKAAAEAAGQPYEGEGPNERIGAAKDRAAEAAEEARQAEEEAEAVRKAAEKRAEAVNGEIAK